MFDILYFKILFTCFLSLFLISNHSIGNTLVGFSNQILIDSIDKNVTIRPDNCKKCLDTFEVKMSINDVFYQKYKINGITNIILPDTLNVLDKISFEEKTWRHNRRKRSFSNIGGGSSRILYFKKFYKMKEYTFLYQENLSIIIKQTLSTKFYFIYKSGPRGCPKFYW